jgi:hypothetical protein
MEKFDLTNLLGSSGISSAKLRSLGISSEGLIESLEVKSDDIRIKAKRKNDKWFIHGEVYYPWTLSGLLRHSLRAIGEETGIDVRKYINKLLGKGWKGY